VPLAGVSVFVAKDADQALIAHAIKKARGDVDARLRWPQAHGVRFLVRVLVQEDRARAAVALEQAGQSRLPGGIGARLGSQVASDQGHPGIEAEQENQASNGLEQIRMTLIRGQLRGRPKDAAAHLHDEQEENEPAKPGCWNHDGYP